MKFVVSGLLAGLVLFVGVLLVSFGPGHQSSAATFTADRLVVDQECAGAQAYIRFDWQASSGTHERRIDLSSDNSFQKEVLRLGPFTGSTSSYIWDTFTSGEVYFTRMSDKLPDGTSSLGAPVQFTTCGNKGSAGNAGFP